MKEKPLFKRARTFECRYCGQIVSIAEDAKDKRTVFCSVDCEKKYWKHAYRYNYGPRGNNRITNFHSFEEYVSYEKRTNNQA